MKTIAAAVAADAIPNLEPRYAKHLKVPPVRRPKELRASFKTTLWWTAAQWVQLLSMSADLKTGRMSLGAFLIDRLGLKDADSTVSRAQQLRAIAGMVKPPAHDDLAERRKRRRRKAAAQ